jgi:hypothetical protein
LFGEDLAECVSAGVAAIPVIIEKRIPVFRKALTRPRSWSALGVVIKERGDIRWRNRVCVWFIVTISGRICVAHSGFGVQPAIAKSRAGMNPDIPLT